LTLAPIELAILQQSAFLSRKTIWIGQNTGKAKWGNVDVIQATRWRVGAEWSVFQRLQTKFIPRVGHGASIFCALLDLDYG
jgi:hypothetical protein